MSHDAARPESAGSADRSEPGVAPRRARPPQPVLIGLGLVAAVVLVLLALILIRPADDEVGDASATPAAVPTAEMPDASVTAAPTSSPLPTPTPAPIPATADLAWNRTGSFPSEEGLSTVDHVAQMDDRYVAVGVDYLSPLPVFGPTPLHEALAWTSSDGQSWEPVDLEAGFENVTFGPLIHRDDGSLVSLGQRGLVDESGGINEFVPAAWTTTDGVTWTEIDPPLEGVALEVRQGAKGVLAVVYPHSGDGHQLWLSADGMAWELVHSLEANYIDIGAGDDGFAAVSWVFASGVGDESGHPISIASADGREWIEAPTPPFGEFVEVASHAGDWIAVDDPGGVAPTWFSANGLDWEALGEIPFKTVDLEDADCREYRSLLISAHPWLVTSTELTYPCSESGYMIHGTQYLSVDGATWSAMPLAEGTPGENRSGSRANDALATDAGLILVGEEDGAAAFWFGEAP